MYENIMNDNDIFSNLKLHYIINKPKNSTNITIYKLLLMYIINEN